MFDYRVSLNRLIILVMVLFLTVSGAVDRVFAQQNTLVMIEPADTNLNMGDSTTLEVKVINGSSLTAFDLVILYEKEVLTLESWSFGSYLSNLSVVMQDSQPGRLHLAATQVAVPGVTGDGTLLKLVFRAVNEGDSEILLDKVQLVNDSVQMILPELGHGWITVTQATLPTFTATLTFTPTATQKPSSTNRPAQNPTLTPTFLPGATTTTHAATATQVARTQSTTVPGSTLTQRPGLTALVNFGTPVPRTSGQVVTPEVTSAGEQTTLLTAPAGAVPTARDASQTAQVRQNTILWVLAVLLGIILIGFFVIIIKGSLKK